MDHTVSARLGEFGVPEAETDTESLGLIEQRLSFRARHRALVVRVEFSRVARNGCRVSLIEIPAREKRRQRQFGENHQITTSLSTLLQQVDQARDNRRSLFTPGNGPELSCANIEIARHQKSVSARASIVRSNTLAPASRSAGSVNSVTLWLMPLTLFVKIIAVGHTRANI